MKPVERAITRAATVLWLCLGTLAACGGTGDETARAAGEAGTAGEATTAGEPGTASDADGRAAPSDVLPGTPAGGLEAWIADIHAGVEGLPALVRREPDSAELRALDLYLSRQEYIERYYGAGGPRAGGDALAAAVDSAEAAFHELMRVTGRTPPPDSLEVARAVETLRTSLEVVLRQAREAGVPLDPPAGRAGAGAGLPAWLDAVEAGLAGVERAAGGGRQAEARRRAARLYLDHYEAVEGFYGPGGPHGAPGLARRVAAGEEAFHALLEAERDEVAPAVARLRGELSGIRGAAREAGVPLRPRAAALEVGEPASPGPPRADLSPRSPEVTAIVRELRSAEAAYAAGDTARALAGVEGAYLEGFELLEPRLPAAQVRRVERLFHLRLRPLIARGADAGAVASAFSAVYAELAAADAALAAGTSFWFGAFNAFAIILREGLEAVLLIAAILAYLAKVSGDDRHRRQVYVGVGLGVAASLATWAVARLLIPVGGAGRELIEGITALLAVAVLVYVSHWLFHKTYVHDWKVYLTERVGTAVSAGSAFAMAALAFAAVYREGFETVLFYQALLFDAGPGALLAGFVPGLLLIVGMGVGMIRLGMRLPLGKVFGVTNAILLYLAFVFLGKGLYNLQEAGLFAPRPLAWAPDHEALRQLLGIYPVAETLAAQAAFLTLVGGSYLWYRRRAARRGRAAERDRPATPSRPGGRVAPEGGR